MNSEGPSIFFSFFSFFFNFIFWFKEDSLMLSNLYGITRIYLAMKENSRMLDNSYGITGLIDY